MMDFLWECMTIAIKGTIGMISIIVIVVFAVGIFVGMIEFFKVIFTSPKPGPEAASEPTDDAALEEELFTVIDGGKEEDEL